MMQAVLALMVLVSLVVAAARLTAGISAVARHLSAPREALPLAAFALLVTLVLAAGVTRLVT
jgi:hypothetical protein